MVGWIKMPLGMEMGFGPGNNDQLPHGKGHSNPHFVAHFALVRSPISAIAELLLFYLWYSTWHIWDCRKIVMYHISKIHIPR